MTSEELVTTSQLARALSLDIRTIQRARAAGHITPEFTTPGGHHRWNVENVRAQFRALRQNDE